MYISIFVLFFAFKKSHNRQFPPPVIYIIPSIVSVNEHDAASTTDDEEHWVFDVDKN